MGRYTGPKAKKMRRLGRSLPRKGKKRLASDKAAYKRKAYPPGQHGNSGRRRKLSQYGKQLQMKQYVKLKYGVREEQLRRLFKNASKTDNAGLALLQRLERRLDNVLYRVGWAPSMDSARQMVSHGHVRVNGEKNTIPSYPVSVGDKITLKKQLWDEKPLRTEWIKIAKDHCIIEKVPEREMIDPSIEEHLIVEYYSK
jgi:small subunit ribosomal protein S4